MSEKKSQGNWIYCENCGKKLVWRKPNGIFIFKFGRRKESPKSVVHLEIFGSVLIYCFRESCEHPNKVTLFP
jgi:hypothetical protein